MQPSILDIMYAITETNPLDDAIKTFIIRRLFITTNPPNLVGSPQLINLIIEDEHGRGRLLQLKHTFPITFEDSANDTLIFRKQKSDGRQYQWTPTDIFLSRRRERN